MLGSGLVKGLAVTAKNLVGSFHDPARLVTLEYPEQKAKVAENYRNFPFLVSEDAADPMGTLRCVACQICEKECPPQCIFIEKSKAKKPDANGRMQLFPAVFDIDISVCMSCQICVEVCPFDAIKMDQHFEIAEADRFNALLLRREQLAKPNSYFHEIHPTEAAQVDEMMAEAARKAAAAAAAKTVKPPPAPAGAGTSTPPPATQIQGAGPGQTPSATRGAAPQHPPTSAA